MITIENLEKSINDYDSNAEIGSIQEGLALIARAILFHSGVVDDVRSSIDDAKGTLNDLHYSIRNPKS